MPMKEMPVAEMTLENYKIQLLTADDVEVFKKLRVFATQESPFAFVTTELELLKLSKNELKGWIGPDKNRFMLGVFSHKGELVGIAAVRRDSWERLAHRGIVWGAYVSPEHRKLGVGQELIKRLIAESVRLEGITTLVLSVSERQHAASALYKKLGFKSYGIDSRALRYGENYISEELLSLDLVS